MRLLFLVALPLARASELTLKLGVLANASKHIASQIETLFDRAEYNTQPTSCTAYNTCAKNLPSGVCDESWGATDGCGCAGRAIDKDHVVVKGSTEVSDADEIKNVVCYTDGIEDTFKAMYDDDSDGMLKWLYYGSSEGVLVNYPGFLWGVADDDTCSDTYDTTERDWYVMGATGPKDVILILGASSSCVRARKSLLTRQNSLVSVATTGSCRPLRALFTSLTRVRTDYSASMKRGARMADARSAAKALLGSLTSIDYVSVVIFYGAGQNDPDCSEGDNGAYSPNNYLVPANSGYRDQMSAWIDTLLEPESNPWGTCYTGAINKAFEITQTSDAAGLTANCTRVYVFMTDGGATDSFDDFEDIITANKRDQDMFFIIGLGIAAHHEVKNKAIACNIGGVYSRVEDNDAVGLRKAVSSYYQYLAMGAMLNEVQPTRFSEPYISIPNIWGPMTTAVTPVYDNTRTHWTMIGVASADVPMCELAAAAETDGWTDDQLDDEGTPTKLGCTCDSEYKWDGQTFNGCTEYKWSKPWCGTTDCGIRDETVSPGGFWDNCETAGTVIGKVETYMREVSSECYMAAQTNESLEVLRGSFTCTSETIDDEWTSMLETANYHSCGATCEWEESGYAQAPYADAYEEWCGAFDSIWNPSTCLECSAEMRPVCAYDQCEASLAAGGVDAYDYCSGAIARSAVTGAAAPWIALLAGAALAL